MRISAFLPFCSKLINKMEINLEGISIKTILIFIGIGIWVIVLQNAGVIPTSQRVHVTNTVGIEGRVDVDNKVEVEGSVDVGIVDINIAKINGRNSFYDHNGNKDYDRIPVYTGD